MSDPDSTSRAGFVLAGGQSSRMGRDKALLPVGSRTLLEVVAANVLAAGGNIVVIGPVNRYGNLGLPVQEDLVTNCGPLGGVYTALATTQSDWNLIVACDMPNATPHFLSSLFEAAESNDATVLAPVAADRVHPLCAVYHRRALSDVGLLIENRVLKMQDALSYLNAIYYPIVEAALLENINTPGDWNFA